MEISRGLRAPCSAERLFAWVEDLTLYPRWMPMVHAVDVAEPDGPQAPAWNVELQAQVGPFARSKRLRMVRTVHRSPREVVFERSEVDGRSHSPWVLRAVITPVADPAWTDLAMELHYGGGLWTGVALQRVLDDEVRRGTEGLTAVVSAEPTH
jgi:hypothetical protein